MSLTKQVFLTKNKVYSYEVSLFTQAQ